MSYWDTTDPADEVRVNGPQEVPCHRCHGTGLVWVQGQETDCIDCDGMGSHLIT